MCASWLEVFSRHRITYALQYHSDQDPDELRLHWGENWGSSLRHHPAAQVEQWKARRADLALQVRVLTASSSDTALRAWLEAWMDRTKAMWEYTRGGTGRSAAW